MSFGRKGSKSAVSGTRVAIVVIIIVILVGGAYVAFSLTASTSSSSTIQTSSSSSSSTTEIHNTSTASSAVQTSSSTTAQQNETLTWETSETPFDFDPGLGGTGYDFNIQQNIYEPLIWFNGSSPTNVIPWLAQSYTESPDGRTFNFTLRSGINFADGEPLNSSAVYFSLNRLLVIDGTLGNYGHCLGQAWSVQQMLNRNLSCFFSGSQSYNATWVRQVLGQDLIQITGPMTFTLHLQEANSAWKYIFASNWADILAPEWVMNQDLSLWTQANLGYTLPYASLSGNLTERIYQYLVDEGSTCNTGDSPGGCATTYLTLSSQGSMAGTGPYILVSFNPSTNDIVLRANPSYWGGAYQYMGGAKAVPHISTIYVNYVPQFTTRELDLSSASKSGQPFIIDLPADQLFDVANRNTWLQNNTLSSIIPGVSLYGPNTYFGLKSIMFATNVTNALTGSYYSFQPFADQRMRLAFADSVNMTEINVDINNKLGIVANGAVPPSIPPVGSYNPNLKPLYSQNLTAVQDLLLSAMMHPITQFTMKNGIAASPELFNNTFGCTALSKSGTCSNPVTQSIALVYPTGDSVNQAILGQMAAVVNNVSLTYNMGLTVSVEPLPLGQQNVYAFQGSLYVSAFQTSFDYPWATDFLEQFYSQTGRQAGPAA